MMTRKVIKMLISMAIQSPVLPSGIDPIFRADAQRLLMRLAADWVLWGKRALVPVRAYIGRVNRRPCEPMRG
jgi:hypothetical protein